jgi:hypothetical protein
VGWMVWTKFVVSYFIHVHCGVEFALLGISLLYVHCSMLILRGVEIRHCLVVLMQSHLRSNSEVIRQRNI